LEFAGDVGGAYEFLYLAFYMLTKYFVEYNFLAIAALRMYTNLNSPLTIPRYFALKMFLAKLGFPRCRQYRSLLKIVEKDIMGSMDITLFLRRLRLHGFALDYLLDKRVLKGLAGMCD
jgi:hypothetical protein